MTARLYALNKSDFAGACLSGHNDALVGAWFNIDETAIYTVAKDGALYEWALAGGEWQPTTTATRESLEKQSIMPRKKVRNQDGKEKNVADVMRWKSRQKFYFNQNHAKVVSAAFHPKTGILSIGFDSGIFGIWEMPDFANIQTLRYASTSYHAELARHGSERSAKLTICQLQICNNTTLTCKKQSVSKADNLQIAN